MLTYRRLADLSSRFKVVAVVGVVLQVFQHLRLGRQSRRVDLRLRNVCNNIVSARDSCELLAALYGNFQLSDCSE